MNGLAAPAAMAAAITGYVGLYHLWLHVSRPRRSDLLFAAICACMTAFDIAAACIYGAPNLEASIPWQRAQLVSLIALALPLVLFVNEQANLKSSKALRIFLTVYPAGSLVAIFDRGGWWLSNTPVHKTITTPWGNSYPIFELEPGPVLKAYELTVPLMIGYCVWVGLGAIHKSEGKWMRQTERSSPLVLASGFLLLAMMHDMVVNRGLWTHPYVLEYAWLGVMVVMSWTLSKEVLEAAQTRLTLEETERRVATTLNAIQDAVVTTDMSGNILHMNPAAEKLIAVNLWDVIDQPLSQFVELTSPETHSVVSDPVRFAVGRPPNPYGRLPQLVTTDGNERHVDVGGSPLKDPQGHVQGAIIVMRDLTLQHNALETLDHAKKMESMGQLAGGAAHDLNNLLTPIISYVELVQRRIDPKSREATFLEHVQDAAQRAAGLTKQLLALSRKQVLDVQIVPLAEFVRQTLPMVEQLVGEDVKLKTQLDARAGKVQIDLGQIEQVILNLASNARDAMDGEGTLSIKVRGLSDGGVALEIGDTGRGMDADTEEHIFEPFFTTKPRGKGTGLGLASVRGIVEQHGGTIFVDSEPGFGTSFEIILPSASGDAAISSARELPPSDLARGSEKILVAEDDPAVRALIHDALSQLGYTVHCADGLTVAVEIAKAETVDLLLTDVVLPGADGPQIRDAVLKHQKIPCLFMTGHADDRLGHHGIVPRGTEVLRKPFTVVQLGERVRAVLDHARIKRVS